METAVINFRTSASVKSKAKALADDLGMDLSSVLNGLLAQFVRTKTLIFSTREEPSTWMIKNLAESEADVKAGRVVSFKDSRDAIAYLRGITDRQRQRSKN